MHGYNTIEAQIYYQVYLDGNVTGITGSNYYLGHIYMVECS